MVSDVFVVARRWDGLGGRLNAILNAWSVARALDLEFRFIWPRTTQKVLNEPREVFDEAFLARFEIAEPICDRTPMPLLTSMTSSNMRALCRAATVPSMIDVRDCFDVFAFADEPKEAAETRFRAAVREIAWSGRVRSLIGSISCAGKPREYSAIHIRAGDIVNGDWRQFVPVEKYVPTALIEFAVERPTDVDAGPVIVVSDNERYVRHLKNRFDFVRSPSEFVSGYSELSEAQRAFADILVLSRARKLVGPQNSAFSKLAANIGGHTVLGIGDLMTEDDAYCRLRDGVAHVSQTRRQRRVLRPLLVRDICWFLDVFPDHLAIGEYLRLARRAVRLEPDFCGALNRLAIASAFVGDCRGSARALTRAKEAASMAKIANDPMFEYLATLISARIILAFSAQRHGDRLGLYRLGGGSALKRLRFFANIAESYEEIEDDIEKCGTLTPFHTDHGEVMFNLNFQQAALTWILAADQHSQEKARTATRLDENELVLSPSWRPSGFNSLGKPGKYSQTLRNLEIATIKMARAIGASLSDVALNPAPMGNVETIRTGPSGLRWVSGWAYDPDFGRNGSRVGIFSADGIVSGGTTYLPRPDVAAALDDPRALHSGFAYPVPETFQDEVSGLQSILQISHQGGCR